MRTNIPAKSFWFCTVWLGALGLINGVSYFLLSDGHGMDPVADGISRLGWPFLIFEKGGIVYRSNFHWEAVLGNFLLTGVTLALTATFAYLMSRSQFTK